MRNLRELDRYRVPMRHIWKDDGDETCGGFSVPSCINRQPLHVIASADGGWDHVSVSKDKRIPNWQEMEQIKRLFFFDDETAMQLHVPPKDHINCHPRTLHLWRPNDGVEIPLQPPELV